MQAIQDWMKTNLESVRPLDSIEHARAVMLEHRVNQLPVVEGDRLIGIITDRDVRDAYPSVFADAAHDMKGDHEEAEFSPHNVKIESVMTADVCVLTPTDTLADAARIMRRERIGAIPVVDGDETQLVGLIARSDVLDAYVALDERKA